MTGAMKIADRQPPWGRFYRLCELVGGCPSVHWGLTRAPQRGIDDLSVVGTSAKVVILRLCVDCRLSCMVVYLPLTVEASAESQPSA